MTERYPQSARIAPGARRIAVVAPLLAQGGGIPELAGFVCAALEASGRYRADLFSLASAARDPAGVQLGSPRSWIRGARIVDGVWRSRPYRHAGAVGSELEWRRYRPRRNLTVALDAYDAVHIVAGTPAWALVASAVRGPVVIHAASLVRRERRALLARGHGARGRWRAAMAVRVDRLDWAALARAATVCVLSTAVRDEIAAAGLPVRVELAPPGVDTAMFRPSLDAVGGATAGRGGYLLSVGRFGDPRKNVRLLFEAYARLRRLIPEPPRLVLAGRTAPTPADWAHAAALGLVPSIDWHADPGVEALATLYRGALAFALSSDEEGFGIVLLEAMASGLAVVSTDCGGPRDIVEADVTGTLTPVGDATALSIALAALLEDPSRRQAMGHRGRERAEREFSLAVSGQRVVAIHDRLAGAA